MSETERLAFLGARIREARERQGLRLRDVADRLGVSIPTVHGWESGINHIPTLRLMELADFIGLDLGRLSRRRVLRERLAA